jgi:acetate kinase
MAALGGADALVFTVGIGENSPTVRAGICGGMERLGIEVDNARNLAGDDVISSEQSRVTVRVMKTNEEIVIARSTAAVLAKVARH